MKTILPLKLIGATLQRKGKTIIGPIDLTIEAQGITVIIGPNGAGKTSLLRMLHGIEPLATGELQWQGGGARARANQGYIFQSPTLLRRNVLENLTYPLRLRKTPKTISVRKASAALTNAGLSAFAQHPARTLSGGEKQKLALARALILEPEILLLDEPCANLDGTATSAIEASLTTVKQTGTRILLTTHDMGQARRLADNVLFILNGCIHEFGPADTFFQAPKTSEARAFLLGDILS